jgi:nucleoside-diphosphate-sugar epimerase
MHVLVIGGTGHIGSFLVPGLVGEGLDVTVVTRGQRKVPRHAAFNRVKLIHATYKREDAWKKLIGSISAEVVMDIVGAGVPFTYEAARPACRHYVATGSVWMLGSARRVPYPPESQTPCPFDWYGMRWRELNETRAKARADGVPFTAVLPPNICGPGKVPMDCKGGRDLEVHKSHMRGEPVQLPEGCNTLIAPCDASDVAQGHLKAVLHRDAAADTFFNVGAPYALTAPHFVEVYADIYGTKIPIEYVSRKRFYEQILPDTGANYHFQEHMAPDISKTRDKLGYEPEFTCEQTMARGVDWMRSEGLI